MDTAEDEKKGPKVDMLMLDSTEELFYLPQCIFLRQQPTIPLEGLIQGTHGMEEFCTNSWLGLGSANSSVPGHACLLSDGVQIREIYRRDPR